MDIRYARWLAGMVLALSAGTGAAHAAVVAHYSFDTDYQDVSGNGAGGTLVDVGTTGNSGIASNAAQRVFGPGALHLDAERDYVSVTSRTFGSGSPYSIAFWARKTGGDTGNAADWDMAVGQRDTTAFFIALGNGTTTPGLRWRSSSSATNRQADFPSVNDTNWHHHVIAASSTSSLAYYLDGALVAVTNDKLTGFTYDTIGEAYTSNDFDFNGQLDEVWIFNETLTATVVSNLYAYNDVVVPQTNTNVVLHLAFEGDYADSSPSSNHGIASGNAALTADPALVPVGSGALQLDGLDHSYIALASSLTFSATNPWSVAFWAQRGETNAGKGMVLGERGTTDDFIWLNDTFTGLRFRNSSGGNIEFTVSRNTNLHHYALVATGSSNLSLYLDGLLSQTATGTTSFTIDTVGQAYTTNVNHYAFQGRLDDVRVYGRALDSNTVAALYQMKNATNAAPVVARLRVVLQAGQSNSDGRGDTAGLPAELQAPQDDIDFYYRETTNVLTTLRPGTSATSGFGPEITTGRGYADLVVSDASTRVAIIKYAVGGTSLSTNWKPGGDDTTTGDGPYYVTFQQTVTNGLAALQALYPSATITIDGMTWMQGESDNTVASTYATNLAAFIADVRATIQPDLPFIVARLSSQQTNVGAGLATLRTAQATVAAADPWSGLVDTDTFPVKPDALHFDAAGQQMLGHAFAFQLLYLQDLTNRFTPAQIVGGTTEPGADADGDGANNEAEFIAGTDATNAASVLKARLTLNGPGLFAVSYPTAAGRHYAVDAQNDGLGTNWTAALPSEAGTGTNVTRAITNSAATGFLRIRAALP